MKTLPAGPNNIAFIPIGVSGTANFGNAALGAIFNL